MKAELFSPDMQEWFRLLHLHQVRYLLVGGHAVIYHGYARLTGDVDILYDPTTENAGRLFEALRAFWGGPVPGIEGPEELQQPGLILQFGRPPHRLDLLSTVDGVDFGMAWARRVTEAIEGDGWAVPLDIISREDLLSAKRASGRPKDLDDLERLAAKD